jgi:hypothetical protein
MGTVALHPQQYGSRCGLRVNACSIQCNPLSRASPGIAPANKQMKECAMMDVLMLALALLLFAAGIGYTYACERL